LNLIICRYISKFTVKDIVVYLLYRLFSAQADSISEIAAVVREAGKNSVFFGDFNLPDIEWKRGIA
jgi:hypothetical protein